MKTAFFNKLCLTGVLFLNINNFENYFVFGNVVEEFLDIIYPTQGCGGHESQAIEKIILTNDKIKELKEMPELERREFLCAREIFQPLEIQKHLRCRYVNRGIPFLKIAPFKEEEIFLEPRILLLHDVISDKEIDIIKNLAKPKFATAGFRNVKSGSIDVDPTFRDTKTGWLLDSESIIVEDLSYRIRDMTQLNMETAEQLQVAYYDVGGHYRPHYDFAVEEDIDLFKHLGTGNRIATVLFYFNDVEEGGNTVFTEINVSLKPKKGAAAFWYNLQPNGERDFLTRHSACPVISGFKWAANKWLHILGQEFHRPCSWNNETIHLNDNENSIEGYHNEHVDHDIDKDDPFPMLNARNRIATLMFYLNDVQEGGKTVYTKLNVTLTPKKGNAVFWHNILPNGDLDFYTMHAGCHILFGVKWVANIWFHEEGQEFRRPCTLENFYDENRSDVKKYITD